MTGRLTKPVLVVLFSALALVSVAVAGSLTPPAGIISGTMHSLADIFDSIASSTYDSSAIVANQNGSLIASLKYMENQTAWASGSNNIWNLNSGNVGIASSSPAYTLTVGGNARVRSSLSIGDIPNSFGNWWGDPGTDVGLGVEKTFAGPVASTSVGIVSFHLANNGAGHVGLYNYAQYNAAIIQPTDSSSYYQNGGLVARANHTGSGVVSDNSALEADAFLDGGGTVNYNYGAYITSTNFGTGTINNGYGIYTYSGAYSGNVVNDYGIMIDSPWSSGVMTNHYGLYINPQNFGTNNWALYQSSTADKNYLAGNVGIGTTDVGSKLEVVGTASVSGLFTARGGLYLPADTLYPTGDKNSVDFSGQTFTATSWNGASIVIPRSGITYGYTTGEGALSSFQSAYGGFRFYTGNNNVLADRLSMVITGGPVSPNTGNVGIGTEHPNTKLTVSNSSGPAGILASASTNATLNTVSSNGSTGTYMTSYRTNANTHAEVLGLAARGTQAAPLALSSGDDIMYFGGEGYTGAAFSDIIALITYEAAATFSATSAPTNMLFSTAASGSLVASERMRIDPNGNVGIGSTAPGAKFVVSGNASISGNFEVASNLTNHTLFIDATNNRVGIGTRNIATDKLEIAGTASISGQLATRGGITSPGTGTNSEQFGNNANASGNGGLAIGNGAIAATLNSMAVGNSAVAQTGTGAMAIGFGASATGASGIAIGGANSAGNSAIAIGSQATAPSLQDIIIGLSASGSAGGISQIAIGANAFVRGSRVVAVGNSVQTRASDVIAIGSGVHADANQIVIGNTTTPTTNLFFNFSSSSAPGAFAINGTGGAGTDVVGANLTIAGGRGTGAARGGSLIFQTANGTTTGAGLNTLATRMTIVASGSIGIGTTGPVHLVHIASSGDGNILRLQDTSGTCDHNPEAGSETVTCSSDISLKTNIVDAPSVLPYFADFRIRSYTIIASGKPMTGVIAQELRLTHPELVATGSDGLLMVQEPNPWLLVKGIQELTSSSLLLDQLLTTDTISTEPSGPLARLVHNVLAFIEQVFHVRIGDGEVKADRLCAGDTCVNSEQLLRILEKSGMSSDVSAPTPTPTPTESPADTTAPAAATPTPEITQLPAETATPTPSDSPEPTPTTTETPTPEAGPTP